MVSYLNFFIPFISINEIGKYLSRSMDSVNRKHLWQTHKG